LGENTSFGTSRSCQGWATTSGSVSDSGSSRASRRTQSERRSSASGCATFVCRTKAASRVAAPGLVKGDGDVSP
jgi:hypothetical protein